MTFPFIAVTRQPAAHKEPEPVRASTKARVGCAAAAVLAALVMVGGQLGLAAHYIDQADQAMAQERARTHAAQASAAQPRRL